VAQGATGRHQPAHWRTRGVEGRGKPIWINETNASPDADPQWPLTRPRWRVDLREQASFILQSYALGLAAGAERIAVYKLMDAGLPPGGEPFGLLRPDHSRRPAYTAYHLAARYYAGTRSARISHQPLLVQVTLDQGGRTTRVFWARTQFEDLHRFYLTFVKICATISDDRERGPVSRFAGEITRAVNSTGKGPL
jgi:hypothetical protein